MRDRELRFGEEGAGGLGVDVDLGLEGIEGGEFLFGAEEVQEGDFEGLVVEIAREVEEVDFELRCRGLGKGRADPEVGDAGEGGGWGFCLDCIDSVGRERAFADVQLEREIGGGEADCAS